MINNLVDEGAEKIFIITDLDEDVCISQTKKRINVSKEITVIVSVKQIEAWLLADSNTLTSIFNEEFFYEDPENESEPRQVLKNLFMQKTGRGIGESKPKFATRMVNSGFTIVNSSTHPNCPSAKYFIQKLQSLLK